MPISAIPPVPPVQPGWPVQPGQPGLTVAPPSDPDPYGRYRTLPTGSRRTSVWFAVLGVALLVLCAPFALPVDHDVVDGDYDTLDNAASDTVLTWSGWSPDLSGLDASCRAPRMQPGMASLYAGCGTATLDLIGTAGVDASGSDADLARAADRAVRAAWSQDEDPMHFVRADVDSLFHPSLASSVGTALVSDTFIYDVGDGPGNGDGAGDGWSPDDGFGGGFGGGVQDVSFSPVAANGSSVYVQAASFTGPGDVMYTLVVSGISPQQVTALLPDMLGRLR